ncbi:unnamed protein product [Sphagnum troendelagicum]
MEVGSVLAYSRLLPQILKTDTGWNRSQPIVGLGADMCRRRGGGGGGNIQVAMKVARSAAGTLTKSSYAPTAGRGILESFVSAHLCSSSQITHCCIGRSPWILGVIPWNVEYGAMCPDQTGTFYARTEARVLCRAQKPQADNFGVEDNFRDIKVGTCDEILSLEHQEQAEILSRSFVDDAKVIALKAGISDNKKDGPITSSVLSWWEKIPKRYIIVMLCFSAFLLCNMDRVNMSIAIMPMSAEFHWSSTTVGLVQSSFFWGYLLTQIAGGIWADSIGGKQVLGFGVIWWSIATIATPIAARIGLPALLFVRACMGVGEGVAMPAMNNLLSRWVPVSERSRSLALVYSGMYLGSVTGLAFSPGLIHKFSWPSVFFSFGSLGAIWFALWQELAHSSPAEDPNITEEEKRLVLGGREPEAPVENIPWGLLLSKAPVWALIVCHFCHNWGTFILLTWMPTYYNQVLGFNLMESGMFSVLPWLTMALSANLGGWIADSLVSRGVSVTAVRKIMQSIGFLGPAFFLTQLTHITSPALAVLCMMCSQGTDAFSQSGLYSNHQDIGPRYSGVLLGMSNTAGVLAGVFGTAATGYILQNGSWDDVFKVAVGLYLFGTVVWNLFSSGEKIFD